MTVAVEERPAGAGTADAPSGDAEALTPTLRARLRRGRAWIWIVAVAVAAVALTFLLRGLTSQASDVPLDPASPTPGGARAVVEVLRDQGVDVTVPGDDAALDDLDPAATTLVVHDLDGLLDADRVQRFADLGFTRIVLVRPGPAVLEALGAPITSAGVFAPGEAALAAGDACPEPLRTDAPALSQTGGNLYTLADGADGWTCYEQDGIPVVAGATVGGTEIVALGAGDALRNDTILAEANAAMALAVLGSQPNLAWYVPAFESADDPASLVPPWLTPAVLLLFAAATALLVNRGRRFGPLVLERLPVVVPASETMDGRARLYDRSRARLRALDQLRVGAVSRLARSLGLPAASGAREVADAVAAETRRPRPDVHLLLVDAEPADDRQLVDLARRIADLERACRAAVLPDDVPADDPKTTRRNEDEKPV